MAIHPCTLRRGMCDVRDAMSWGRNDFNAWQEFCVLHLSGLLFFVAGLLLERPLHYTVWRAPATPPTSDSNQHPSNKRTTYCGIPNSQQIGFASNSYDVLLDPDRSHQPPTALRSPRLSGSQQSQPVAACPEFFRFRHDSSPQPHPSIAPSVHRSTIPQLLSTLFT